jgi:hypothetical protein
MFPMPFQAWKLLQDRSLHGLLFKRRAREKWEKIAEGRLRHFPSSDGLP